MSNYPVDQVLSPPDIPVYLEDVFKLTPIIGVPSDDEVIGIHAVIRVANKVVDAKYRSKYPCNIFPMNITYMPPKLPDHVPVSLGPVSGLPSEEEVTKVQNAIRSYRKYIDVPSFFDPQVNAELNQHLFNIQMARYIHRCGRASPVPEETPQADSAKAARSSEEVNTLTNNAGRGSDIIEPYQSARSTSDVNLCEAIERSNRIAERANELAERSNQLIDRSNQISDQLSQVIEQSNQAPGQSSHLVETLAALLGGLNGHFEQSNRLTETSTKQVERLGDKVERLGDKLKNINRVLVGIQHAIIRNHKGNTTNAVDCLVNEKGNTPGMMASTYRVGKISLASTYLQLTRYRAPITQSAIRYFSAKFSERSNWRIPLVVDGVSQHCYIPNDRLGDFLYFYDIGDGLFQNEETTDLIPGKESVARTRLGDYFSSRLG